jgi:hypothetical protein
MHCVLLTEWYDFNWHKASYPNAQIGNVINTMTAIDRHKQSLIATSKHTHICPDHASPLTSMNRYVASITQWHWHWGLA